MRFLPPVILALALTLAPVYGQDANTPKGIQGEAAPLLGVNNWIQLPEGKETLEITDYKGKTVVMLLFQDTCEACHKRAFPTLKMLVDKFGDREELAFLAIQTPFEDFSDNTESKLQPTAEEFGLTIPFGHLAKTPGFRSINVEYKTGGTPWWVIVDPDGVVDYNGFYLNPGIAVENLDKILSGESID